jgi:hypothetical protein
MSTKTLRKRIALVAVSALGAGLLSVAPATAADGTDIAAANVSITSTTGTATANIGICKVTADESATVTTAATLTFELVTNGTGYIKIDSGAASFTGVTNGTLNGTATKATFASSLGAATLKASAVGTVNVTAYTTADVAVEAYVITVVAACAGDTLSVAKSFVQGTAAGAEATTNIDVANSLDVTAAPAFISVALNDAYGQDLATNGALVATATNGALIGWNTTGTASSAVAATTAATGFIKVTSPTTLAPVSTVVTITFNGTTVATKSVVIRGKATKLVIGDVTVGHSGVAAGAAGSEGTTASTTNGAGYFTYQFLDAAGNVVTNDGGTRGYVAATSLTGLDALVTAANGVVKPTAVTGAASYGEGEFSCADSTKSGSTTLVIAGTNAALETILSSPVTLSCGGDLDTWTIALDKAVYAPGDIATLTVTGKDANGKAVADDVALAGATSYSSPGGGATFVTAPLDANLFVAGVKKYTMIVGNTEGSYNATMKLAGDTETSAKVVSYGVKSTSTAVSNADVLKAIVSLIASINKQIAALQKALLKK